LDIGQDKLKHLSVDSIVQGLAVCTRTASPSGFTLIEDAFSSNERNFRPEEVEKHLSYLGIDKVWQKLARENTMQTALGSANQSVVEQRARQTLTTAMQRRNDIVHRGKSYYTPSQSEVGDCTVFLSTLVVSLAEIMYKRLNTL
jgi:hypothetical protein